MNVKIFIYKNYNKIANDELAALIDSLPEFRRRDALSYASAANQKARAVVYRLLRDELGYNPTFAYNQFGKPYVMCNTTKGAGDGGGETRHGENAAAGQPVTFNFSHSKTIAAAAVAGSSAELGLDVEDSFSERRAAAAARIMTEAEKQLPEQAVKFWTLKESYLKCLGTGISGGTPLMPDFSPWAAAETFSAYEKCFFSRQFEGFHLSLCAACPISVTVLFANLNV